MYDFGSVSNTLNYEKLCQARDYFKAYAKEVKSKPQEYQCEDADKLQCTANILTLIIETLDLMWK